MIIKTLVENTSLEDTFHNEHGLSLYIEAVGHKILFDLGQGDLFLENAKKMDVDIEDIDIVIISHGHFDHGGGLGAFLSANTKAKIYLNKKAFDDHYSKKEGGEFKNIGLDKELIPNEQIVLVEDYHLIVEGLELYSNIESKQLNPSGNKNLMMAEGSSIINDDFAHEQNLIISENDKTLLVAGCAHCGIVNIIEQVSIKEQKKIDYIIGGFHLYNRSTDKFEDPVLVSQIGDYLKNTDTKYYTCHCTGIEPYNILKDIMGEKIDYLSTGSQLII